MICPGRHFAISVVLTALFAVLNYMGAALYGHTDGITTIKPFGGVALAMILIFGRGWRAPVLMAGLAGGIAAKLFVEADLFEAFAIPCLTTAVLFATDRLCQRLIGQEIDFRAWRQLVCFIAIAAMVGAISGFAYAFEQHLWKPLKLSSDWQAWAISITLSYVIFTPLLIVVIGYWLVVIVGGADPDGDGDGGEGGGFLGFLDGKRPDI